MIRKELCIALVICALASISSVHAQEVRELYISPSGDDKHPGSKKRPFASIEKARNHIRSLKQKGQDQAIVVYLREGVYTIDNSIRFGEEDSGSEQAPITYTAYQDEKVILSGGKVLKGWQSYDDRLWCTKIPDVAAGQWAFRQLYVNGKSRPRARIPNEGFKRAKGFPDGGPEVHFHTNCKRFEFAAGDIDHTWTNLDDVEVIVYHFWTDSHLPIQSIDTTQHIVTFKHNAGKVFTDDFTDQGARYIVENVWEGLDSPGEWYLNEQTGMLYYYPLPGEVLSQLEVIAPLAPALLHLEGSTKPLKPLAHLHFKGIHFMYTHWDLPPGNSNDAQGASSVPAAIRLKWAKDIVFEDCRIQNIGTYAFDLQEGSQQIQIRHCELSYLGGGGIRINGGGVQAPPFLHTKENIIEDNYLHHYGEVFPSAVGILIMHSSKNVIAHNEIHHGEYTGISVGWSWGYGPSISTHNLIAYNHIHHIGQSGLLSDMGAIYTLGVSPGTVIRNNLIHDISANHYGGWGIYNDEGSAYIAIENNIVYNTKFAPYNIHYGKELVVSNNIFALGEQEQISRGRMEPHKSVLFKNNIVYWKEGILFNKNWQDQDYPSYFKANDNAHQMHSTFEADYNLYFNPDLALDTVKFNGQSWQQWRKRGKDTHSIYADPMFRDVAKYDFGLLPLSPALHLGFQSIDMSTVGVRDAK